MEDGAGEIQTKTETPRARCKLEQNNFRGPHQSHNEVLGQKVEPDDD